MASYTFKPLPPTTIGRKRYSIVYDPNGNNLPRKKQLTTTTLMEPTIVEYIPGNHPVGVDTKVPTLPGGR